MVAYLNIPAAPEPYWSWPDDCRGIANDLLRCAFFGIERYDPTLRERKLFANGGLEINWFGPRYSQYHLDVFCAVMHLARGLSPDAEIRTTRYRLLELLHVTNAGGKNYKDLRAHLLDLHVGTIIVKTNGYEKTGGALLEKVEIDENNDGVVIKLNPRMRPLWDRDSTSYLQWSDRKKLTSPLDKWLHAFWLSHRDGVHAMKVETYRNMTGYTGTLFAFRRKLKDSFARLRALNLIEAAVIGERDKVYVAKLPSKEEIEGFKKRRRDAIRRFYDSMEEQREREQQRGRPGPPRA